MFRIRRNISDSFKSQRKLLARYFASTPTLPEFADVVIIGKSWLTARKKQRKEKQNLTKLLLEKDVKKRNFELCEWEEIAKLAEATWESWDSFYLVKYLAKQLLYKVNESFYSSEIWFMILDWNSRNFSRLSCLLLVQWKFSKNLLKSLKFKPEEGTLKVFFKFWLCLQRSWWCCAPRNQFVTRAVIICVHLLLCFERQKTTKMNAIISEIESASISDLFHARFFFVYKHFPLSTQFMVDK